VKEMSRNKLWVDKVISKREMMRQGRKVTVKGAKIEADTRSLDMDIRIRRPCVEDGSGGNLKVSCAA
jgi:hypothetical protein